MTTRSRGGFTLIEVLVAVAILGLLAVGLTGTLLRGARQAQSAGSVGYRTAALNTEVSRVAALPAGALAAGTTTRTVTTQPFPHTVTTTVATSGTLQTVTITVTPTGQRAIAAASTVIERTTSGAGASPFLP